MPLNPKNVLGMTDGLTAEPEEAVSIWTAPNAEQFCTHLCRKKTPACAQTPLVIPQSENSKKDSELFKRAARFWKLLLLHGYITTGTTRTVYTFNSDDENIKNLLVKGKK